MGRKKKLGVKMGGIWIDADTMKRIEDCSVRSGRGVAEVRRIFYAIGLDVYEYTLRRGMSDLENVKKLVNEELGKRQLKLFVEKDKK